MGELWLAKGKIEVKDVKGFWFTAGGEKGSFGYYPHLKDGELPVFPDTQIHGDLRMAVSWLLKLKGRDPDDVNKIFGDIPKKDRRELASKVFITDLKPSNSNIVTFSIKPRIAIGDDRTTKEDMLVNFECAYFNNEPLAAKIYLGYFKDKKELEEAIDLIKDAASLLSGFGAFRSRGYSRGKVEINWETNDIHIKNDLLTKNSSHAEITIFLKPLVNFRNKQIDPGKGQLLDTIKYISSAQLRGWFVKAYNYVFDDCPKAEEMASMQFADLYPSDCDEKNGKCLLGYPAPTSTIKFENGDIVDMWSRAKEKKEGWDKPKPLSATSFVTAENDPRIIELRTDKRMRNSTNPNFSTKDEGGLFAQEFVKEGNFFGGKIMLPNMGTEFGKRAFFILSNKDLCPIINGAIFEKHLYDKQPSKANVSGKPYLVISSLDCDDSVWKLIFGKYGYEAKEDGTARKKNAPQISITTQQRYNIQLKRPRRNRIVVAQGSILLEDKGDKTIQWSGFGTLNIPSEKKIPPLPDVSPTSSSDKYKMSRSQAGQLREFLSPVMSGKLMEKIITERIKKYDRWNKDEDKINKRLVPKKVFTEIKSKLEDKSEKCGLKAAQKYIMDLLDEYKLAQWEEDYNKTLKKFQDVAKEKGYIND